MPGPARSAFLSRTSIFSFVMKRSFLRALRGNTRAQGKGGCRRPGQKTGADASGTGSLVVCSPMIRAHGGDQPCPAPNPRCPLRGRRSRSRAASCIPDRPSFRSSKVMATGRTSGGERPRPRRRRREGLSRKRKIAWMEVFAGEKAFDNLNRLASGRDRRRVPRVPRRHQGAAHDAHRRRDPLAECRAAAVPRPVRLPAPCALVQGRPFAGQAPREGGHGHLPREHGRHLRGHRVRAGSEEEEVVAFLRASFPAHTRRSASRRRPASA